MSNHWNVPDVPIEDRETFVKDNAVAIVQQLEKRIKGYQKTIQRLEASRKGMRQHRMFGKLRQIVIDHFPAEAANIDTHSRPDVLDLICELLDRLYRLEN